MDVKVYAIEGCPYCKGALELLKVKGIKPDVKIMTLGTRASEELKEYTGQKTYPQIFINSMFIGGFSDLKMIKL